MSILKYEIILWICRCVNTSRQCLVTVLILFQISPLILSLRTALNIFTTAKSSIDARTWTQPNNPSNILPVMEKIYHNLAKNFISSWELMSRIKFRFILDKLIQLSASMDVSIGVSMLLIRNNYLNWNHENESIVKNKWSNSQLSYPEKFRS